MTDHNKTRLTSAEMTSLWTGYMNDSMAICVFNYFLNNVDDTDVKPVLEYSLEVAQEHIKAITDIFNKEGFPIPQGFSDEDVNLEAPRLYSDLFYLYYLHGMATIGLATYGASLSLMARSDVATYFNECLTSSIEIMNKAREVMLHKGVYVRPPYISTPNKVEFVLNKDFYGGFFGNKRQALTGVEISHLFLNSQNNTLGRALLVGFAQVAKSKNIREYLFRGVDIAKKHTQIFNKILADSYLPTPNTWDSDVLDSTVAPFSDKLMMFHTSALNVSGTGNYGLAIAASPRTDIATTYFRLQMEIGQYAKSGTDIMIKNGWLEQPPTADDRKGIAGV
jgi:hypothetical protein|nr:DUF3231 family protein [Heyndrickxia oleronia]